MTDVSAQCGDRYLEEIFEEVTMETVVYDIEENKSMDIYYPEGDDAESRPLALFAHGGSFYAGSRDNSTMIALCESFAKRGYVAASLTYELAAGVLLLGDSLHMKDIVVKAFQDGKEAIRYFGADAAENNNYKADLDQVIVGGNSAGAILTLHLAYMNEGDDIPEDLATIVENNGGLDGTANLGYEYNIKGVVNLAGGLNTLSLLDENDANTFCYSAHGDMDGTVPFLCDDVFAGDEGGFGLLDLVDICGSGVLNPAMDELGIPNKLVVYEGADHVPWSAGLENGVTTVMQDLMDDAAASIYPYIECEDETPLSIDNFDNQFALFPSIAGSNDVISIEGHVSGLSIFSVDGKLISSILVSNGTFIAPDKPGFYIANNGKGESFSFIIK